MSHKGKMKIDGKWIICEPKTITLCETCGKEKVVYKSNLARNPKQFCDMTCYTIWQSENRKGIKNGAYGIKRPDLIALNKSRIGIPLMETAKAKQRVKIIEYWQSIEGQKQKEITSMLARDWIKTHKQEFMEHSKLGHKSCPRISSQEVKISLVLKQVGITFFQQYEYDLGFIDIFIPPRTAIFIDGKHWHHYPFGTAKDKLVDARMQELGFKTIRLWDIEIDRFFIDSVNRILWESEIKSDLLGCIKKVREAMNPYV